MDRPKISKRKLGKQKSPEFIFMMDDVEISQKESFRRLILCGDTIGGGAAMKR